MKSYSSAASSSTSRPPMSNSPPKRQFTSKAAASNSSSGRTSPQPQGQQISSGNATGRSVQVIDASALEAQFLNQSHQVNYGEEIIEFDDELNADTFGVDGDELMMAGEFDFGGSTAKFGINSGSSAMGNLSPKQQPPMTMEQLEAQFKGSNINTNKVSSSMTTSNNNMPTSSSNAPPPGLPPGLSSNAANSATVTNTNTTSSAPKMMLSSAAPLPVNDPNREFMNKYERDLITRIHTTQLTTENPALEDFYYQAYRKKQMKKLQSGQGGNGPQPLYFPLPQSGLDRNRRGGRDNRNNKKGKGKDGKEKDGKDGKMSQQKKEEESPSMSAAALVLGKISSSSSRKPRQQLQIPSVSVAAVVVGEEEEEEGKTGPEPFDPTKLHAQVLQAIESVYQTVLSVEDLFIKEQQGNNEGFVSLTEYDQQVNQQVLLQADLAIKGQLGLDEEFEGNQAALYHFIHFLTVPKGKSILSRALKLLSSESKETFLLRLIKYFDFLEIVRPETPLTVVDSFITGILSPLVAFVGSAPWTLVMTALRELLEKRSFVWIALTKSGMVLLCILLSRLEILRAAGADPLDDLQLNEESSVTERIFDALSDHLTEFFQSPAPINTNNNSPPEITDNREFYAWQFMALLAMNVDADRKRTMILELRDRIMATVETGNQKAIGNLNVFLNALGLDASQLQ